jgi:hypothetical protein
LNYTEYAEYTVYTQNAVHLEQRNNFTKK